MRVVPEQVAMDISIRAPARGATGQQPLCIFDADDFNPRSREGSDQEIPGGYFNCRISIRAPARGATRIVCNDSIRNREFQSALPRGERRYICHFDFPPCLFQSALPRGERPLSFTVYPFVCKFQSALPRGERL